MATTDRHDFLLWAAGFTQSDTILNDLLLKLEVKLDASVISRTVTAQPATPTAGDMYIIPAGATGAQWATFAANDITIFRDSTWYAFTPIKGWPAWVEDAAEGVVFDGSAWAVTLVANAIVDADFAAAEGFMRKTGAGAYVAHKSNLTAIVAPTATDDSAAGYSVGSIWLDTVAVAVHTCTDATAGAAVWATGGGLNQTQVDARVVAYKPGMMQYDGSTGYYSKTYTSAGNKVTLIARFRLGTFTTDYRYIGGCDGGLRSRGEAAMGPSDAATVDERNKLIVFVLNSAGTQICRLISAATVNDSLLHTFFFSFDGDAGTAIFYIDGVDADNVSASSRVAPTAGTLETGASSRVAFGRNPQLGATTDILCQIGFVGHHEAYLTNWSDFMNADGSPKQLNETAWTEWGTQPLFFNPHGQMDNNKGSAGNMTKTGTILVSYEQFGLSTGLVV